MDLRHFGIVSFGGGFFELSRACEVESGMASDGIVEPVDVAADGLVGFLTGVEDSPPDELGFQGLKERLHYNQFSLSCRADRGTWSSWGSLTDSFLDKAGRSSLYEHRPELPQS